MRRTSPPPPTGSSLSPIEIQILAGVARGHTNLQIGTTLGRSELTIKDHVARIGHRLGATHRAAMVSAGYRGGYLTGLSPEPRKRVALSTRQQQLLDGMAEGLMNGEIGARHFLAEDTVKTHARGLFALLQASNRAHAVALAFQQGLLTCDRPAEAVAA